MKKEKNNLEELKGKNPFKVPEGYMEGLTSQIMSQLPEKPRQKAKTVTMMDRARPWLYMAASFIGLLLFFKAIVGITNTTDGTDPTDSLLVHTEIPSETKNALYVADDQYDEDDEYLEYLENQYASYILAQELGFSD